jgi:hypothetical protein
MNSHSSKRTTGSFKRIPSIVLMRKLKSLKIVFFLLKKLLYIIRHQGDQEYNTWTFITMLFLSD